MVNISLPFRYPNKVPVVALSVKRAFLGDFAKSATILHPEVSIGKSLKMRKRPPILGGFSFFMTVVVVAVVLEWWRSG